MSIKKSISFNFDIHNWSIPVSVYWYPREKYLVIGFLCFGFCWDGNLWRGTWSDAE